MRYSSLLLLPALLVLAPVCKKSPGGRKNLLFESGFEGSNFLAGWSNDQHCCDYSVQQSSEVAREGSSSLRLEVRNTDAQVSNSIRSEITLPGITDQGEMWYGLSLYFKDWTLDHAGSTELQWHPDNSGGSSVLSLRTTNGEYEFVHGSNATGFTYGQVPARYRTVIPNVWVDLVFHIKWATGNTGFIEVWKDGVQVYNIQGVRTDFDGQYLKAGINAFAWSQGITDIVTTRVFFVDNVRIGNASATYDDVKPGN